MIKQKMQRENTKISAEKNGTKKNAKEMTTTKSKEYDVEWIENAEKQSKERKKSAKEKE